MKKISLLFCLMLITSSYSQASSGTPGDDNPRASQTANTPTPSSAQPGNGGGEQPAMSPTATASRPGLLNAHRHNLLAFLSRPPAPSAPTLQATHMMVIERTVYVPGPPAAVIHVHVGLDDLDALPARLAVLSAQIMSAPA